MKRSFLFRRMTGRAVFVTAAAVVFCVQAAPDRRVAGSGLGGNSPYATDAYPGFDGLDSLPVPEKKETSWFLGVSCDTPAEQLAWAREKEAEGSWWRARRGYDALVREWPASPEAPEAQLALVKIQAAGYKDYEEAVEELFYLLDFYPRACDYLEQVEYAYRLVNLMLKDRKTFLGFPLVSVNQCRQFYESIVRRAPGMSYVPDAMLRIAALREEDQQYEEAVKVYGALTARYPLTPEAQVAVYREAKARMWVCRRLAYNIPRCRDTERFLTQAVVKYPALPEIEELKQWLGELRTYLAEDAYRQAKFYDSRQRTRHAAKTAWERYLQEYPDSPHADEVRARIEALGAAGDKAK